MKNLLQLCLIFGAAFSLTAAPAAQTKKKADNTKAPKAAAPKSTDKAASKAVPAKPVVEEKKQPYELWLSAHTQALEAVKAKKYDEAFKFFDQAIKDANRGVWKNYSLYEKALLLGKLERYDEAVALLRQKVSRDRNTTYHRARTALMCGEFMMAAKKYSEARTELQKALDSGLNNWITADAELDLGKIAEIRKDYAAAARSYKKIFSDEERLPGIRVKGLLCQITMMEKQKKYKEALAFLDANSNIEQIPADRAVDLAFKRSDLQVALKDLKGAYDTCSKAMTIQGKPNPWTAGLMTRMAKILFRQKKYHEAQNMMRRARNIRGHEWGYDREFHKSVDQIVQKINRERVLRERKARLERQRRARLERERKAKMKKASEKNK